jgi:hypothetical protein
MGGEFL